MAIPNEATLLQIMYFGNRDVTLWYRGGHDTLLMATIDGIIFCLDDEADRRLLRNWADRMRLDPRATLEP